MSKKVQVLIYAKKDHLLLRLKLVDNRGGFWQNITGHVEPHEAIERAAQREVKEEIGLDCLLSPLPYQFSFHDRFGHDVTEYVYFAHVDESFKPNLSEEHSAYEWKCIHDITPEDFGYPSNYKALEILREIFR